MNVKNLKWFLMVVIGVTVLIGIRLVLTTMYQPSNDVQAVNGVIDLRDQRFDERAIYALNGEWEFYPFQFLTNKQMKQAKHREMLMLPNAWNEAMAKYAQGNPAYGYGTYHLRMLVPHIPSSVLALKLNLIRTAYEVEINGVVVHTSGHPATNAAEAVARSFPYVQTLKADTPVIDVIIRVSNYDIPSYGGIYKTVTVSTPVAIEHAEVRSLIWSGPFLSILALFSIISLVRFIVQRENIKHLYIALFLVSYCTFCLSIGEKWMSRYMLELPYTWHLKINYLAMDGSIFAVLFVYHIYAGYIPRWLLRILVTISGAHAVLVLLTPFSIYAANFFILILAFMLNVFVLIYFLVKLLTVSAIDRWVFYILLVSLCSYAITLTLSYIGRLDETIAPPFELYLIALFIIYLQIKDYYSIYLRTIQLNNELLLQDKLKDEFLANTTHELRTPIHAIMNVTQAMLKTQPRAGMVRQLLLVYRVTVRMSQLLNDITDFSKMKMGILNFRYRKIELVGLLEHVREITDYLIADKPIRFHVQIAAGTSNVWADEDRLVQILINLIQNAIAALDEGEITIHVANVDDAVRFVLSDTGMGIDSERVETIQALFANQQLASMNVIGRHGIGLSVCKNLIEKMGGTIRLESAKGQGTTVAFTLPHAHVDMDTAPITLVQHQAQQQTPSVLVQEEAVLNEKSDDRHIEAQVLIVDDDETNLQILHDMLVSHHYEVFQASSGEQALSLLATGSQFDLVILDLMLPDLSGYQVCRAIRESFTPIELPVLIVTARSQPEDLIAGFDSGANDFVLKPVGADELLARVKTLVHMKHAIDQKVAMEIAYRQAQITPHFLFNTLNSIAVLMQFDVAKANELLVGFSSYLRSSFQMQNIADVVPLHLEMELVKAYLKIEQVRFPGMFVVHYDIADDISFDLPPLTLQPLVENAVLHGVGHSAKEREANIRITVRTDGKYYFVEVADSGGALSEPFANEVLAGRVQAGIGMRNIHLRLKQRFGSGLQVSTQAGVGTTVSFQIPVSQ